MPPFGEVGKGWDCKKSQGSLFIPRQRRRSADLRAPSPTLPWARGFLRGSRVRGLCRRDGRGLVSSGSRGGSAAPSKPNSPAGGRRERERGLLHPLQNLQATRKVGIKPERGRKMSVCLLTLRVVLATLVYDVRNYFCHWRIVMRREAG